VKYLYAERDIEKLDEIGEFYCQHVDHMTREALHSKCDIAAELGFRDAKIAIYEKHLDQLSRLGNGQHLGNSDGNCLAQEALRKAKNL
jgi:hypothetical protein